MLSQILCVLSLDALLNTYPNITLIFVFRVKGHHCSLQDTNNSPFPSVKSILVNGQVVQYTLVRNTRQSKATLSLNIHAHLWQISWTESSDVSMYLHSICFKDLRSLLKTEFVVMLFKWQDLHHFIDNYGGNVIYDCFVVYKMFCKLVQPNRSIRLQCQQCR